MDTKTFQELYSHVEELSIFERVFLITLKLHFGINNLWTMCQFVVQSLITRLTMSFCVINSVELFKKVNLKSCLAGSIALFQG